MTFPKTTYALFVLWPRLISMKTLRVDLPEAIIENTLIISEQVGPRLPVHFE